ncbi:MAG TPA: hypothetical protein ENF21_01220 [Bacteroidetes bacterium]|nr:hypothetical protein [Bacteroidota bacterium]
MLKNRRYSIKLVPLKNNKPAFAALMVQTVLFAAGEAPTLYPFTVNKPGALVQVMNRSLLEYVLDQLAPFSTEWIVIVGHDDSQITKAMGSAFKKKPIKFLKLDQPWTWHDALLSLRPHIKGHFLFVPLELIPARDDLKNLMSYNPGMLTYDPKITGSDETHVSYVDGGQPHEIIHPGGVRPSIFFFTHSLLRSLSAHKGPFQAFLHDYMLKQKARIICSGHCLPVRYAWDLLAIHKILLRDKKMRIRGTVEQGVTLKGNVWVGAGTLIKTGTYIEGPVMIGNDCVVGPNSYIRGSTCIGNRCRVGNAVEIKNSVIGNNTHISHLSYLGDSIIGSHVNIGAGNISANLRHDGKMIITPLNGEKIKTGRNKLGVLIGDEVHTGIHNSFYPGTKIWPRVDTLPGQVVSRDLTG